MCVPCPKNLNDDQQENFHCCCVFKVKTHRIVGKLVNEQQQTEVKNKENHKDHKTDIFESFKFFLTGRNLIRVRVN